VCRRQKFEKGEVVSAAGEIYFIGEKDLRTKEITSYYKVGIVRENLENADRSSTQRLLEHQTGNPRELYIESIVKSDLVELVETLLHKNFAPLGVRGEWMLLNASQLKEVQERAEQLANEANEITADLNKADALSKVVSSDELIPSTPELVALNEMYLESNAKLKACNEMLDAIKEIFAEALEDEDEEEEVGIFAQIQERQKSVFDEEAFKSAHSAIYAKFVVTKTTVKGTPSFAGSRGFKKEFKDFDPGFASMVDGFATIVEKIQLGEEKKEKLHGFSLELRRVNAEAIWSKMKAESKIKVACGTHAGIDGLLKWARTEKVTESLDKKALKQSHPELVAEFTTAGDVVKAVIVDPKKGY
jgi:hypothetical protein